MAGYERMRDRLRSKEERFLHLDATQLVKHAFGLVTEGRRRKKMPVLYYIFAEPATRAGHAIPPDTIKRHREEIEHFADAVAGDEVAFHFSSYREWLDTWSQFDSDIAVHRETLLRTFEP